MGHRLRAARGCFSVYDPCSASVIGRWSGFGGSPRGFTGFTESADAGDVMALLRDYHAAIGEIVIKYGSALGGAHGA